MTQDTDAVLLEEASALVKEIIRAGVVNITLPPGDNWPRVAFAHLTRSCDAMEAIHILAERRLQGPTDVLVRHLFELAVNLKYMVGHPERLAKYLEHSTSLDEIVHSYPWEHVKKMCKELELLTYYDTIYRITSDTSHGGSFGMRLEVAKMAGWTAMESFDLTKALWTGLSFYCWVVEINCDAFPNVADAFAGFLPGTAWNNRLDSLSLAIYDQLAHHTQPYE